MSRMERLTRKSLEYKDTWIANGSLSNIEGVVRGNAIDRLAELEDVLEEFELTSAEDLRNYLNFKTNMAIWEGELNYKNKISDLEQQLHDLPKKIVAEVEKNFTEYLPLKYKTGAGFYSRLNSILKKYGGEDE